MCSHEFSLTVVIFYDSEWKDDHDTLLLYRIISLIGDA